mmetsp:Transcript_75132/g.199519  ORF Transcript_75132/g.199519 Transcript_75132/m.199519 type:complete len:489 (-) Transcript_75132:186-1652(-)
MTAMNVTVCLWMDRMFDCSFCPSFSMIGCTKGSRISRSTSCPYSWKASMLRATTRWQGSSSAARKSGSSCCASGSAVTKSEWSSANWATALQAACLTLGFALFKWTLMPDIICETVGSSSTYSTIWESTVMPATTCFHSEDCRNVASTGFKVSRTCGNFSALFIAPLRRSTTSLPFLNCSSSLASSSSSSAHACKSSLISIMKPTLMSRSCSIYPGTLDMAFWRTSAKEMRTSKASLRISSGLFDLATARKKGKTWVGTASLKKSTEFCVPTIDCNTALMSFSSPPSATRCRAPQSSFRSGAKMARSSFVSKLSTSSRNMHEALACTGRLGSTRHPFRTSPVWSLFATITGQTDVRSSLTAQTASARKPASLELSMTTFSKEGITSGHSVTFCGLWPSSMVMSWLPRLWRQSASFLRTLACASASKSCRSCALLSACACCPSFAQMESSSLSLARHCLSSTVACSRRASSSCGCAKVWKSAATVVPGC